jgi:hypothetical protein
MRNRGMNKVNVDDQSRPQEQNRGTGGKDSADRAQAYKPRGSEGLGFARKRDIDDRTSQKAAPTGPGRWDRTGEDEYAEGLEEFEEGAGESQSAAAGAEQKPKWELDEGGVQFGRGARRNNDADAGKKPAAGGAKPRSSTDRSR